MTTILFIVGAVTCLGCGWNITTAKNSNWKVELVWTFGGLIGAAMMAFAALLSNGWQP